MRESPKTYIELSPPSLLLARMGLGKCVPWLLHVQMDNTWRIWVLKCVFGSASQNEGAIPLLPLNVFNDSVFPCVHICTNLYIRAPLFLLDWIHNYDPGIRFLHLKTIVVNFASPQTWLTYGFAGKTLLPSLIETNSTWCVPSSSRGFIACYTSGTNPLGQIK